MLKTGIVLVGFGEPLDSSPKAVRRFCKKVLLEHRRSKGNRFFWWLKVRFGMLQDMSEETTRSFRAIWPNGDFPERETLHALRNQLQQRLAENDAVAVYAATLYGSETVEEAFRRIKMDGCHKVILLPLFPQSSFSTDQVLHGRVRNAVRHAHLKAEIDSIGNYYRNETYARALAASIEHAGFDAKAGDRLLMAYASIPLNDIERGDEYELQTGATSLAIASELDLPRDAWTMAYFATAYDSREHLDPYVRDVVERWGRFCEGRMFIVCPGYACEGICTQYYVNRVLRRRFGEYRCGKQQKISCDQGSVATDFVYVPALGRTRAHLKVLTSVLAPYMKEGYDGKE